MDYDSDEDMPELIPRSKWHGICDSDEDEEKEDDESIPELLESQEFEQVFVVNETNETEGQKEKFLLDSGASLTIVKSDEKMIDIKASNKKVKVGNEAQVIAKTEGNLYVSESNSDRSVKMQVAYCPDFAKNVISGPKLIDAGCNISFNETHALVTNKEGKVVMRCERDPIDRMYYFVGTRITKTATDQVFTNDEWKDAQVEVNEQGQSKQEKIKQKPKNIDINEAHYKMGHKGTALLKATCKHLGINLMGQLKPCEACGVAKAKQKAVAKTTNVVAEKPCERLFCDISGPFTTTLGGNRYWIQVVDDYTRFGWVHFCKKKNEMGPYMKSLVETLAGMGHKVAYIRCDNAGENEKPLETLCNQNGATLELTAPDTPQQNGVVERRIAILRQRAHALMAAADLTKETQDLLWAEAVAMANDLENVTSTTKSIIPAQDKLFGRSSKRYGFMIEFGRIGQVTIRKQFIGKWKEKSEKMIVVGFAKNHSPDTYRMYNPTTRHIISTRDVEWLEWKPLNPKRDLSIFNQHPEFEPTSGLDDKEFPQSTAPSNQLHIIPDDTDTTPSIAAGRMEGGNNAAIEGVEQPTVIPEDDDDEKEKERVAAQKASKLERELRRLDASFNPTTTTIATQDVIEKNNEETQVHFVFNAEMMIDHDEPKTFNEAMNRNDKEKWAQSAASEVMNFIKRKCWKKVSREIPSRMGKKVLRTKWVFKIKDEHDGSKRYKSRIVSKGYEQVPGVDFRESFSPVASETTVRIGMGFYLYYENFEIEMIDIEAAFLEGEIDEPVFIEWPDGFVEMGFINEEEKETKCIQLLKSIYGNVDAALRFYRTLSKYIVETMDMKMSKTDPCLFFKKDEQNRLVLVAICHVDDTLLIGVKKEIEWYKTTIKKRFGIKDLGKLTKHLGIWYEEKIDKNGEKSLVATMPKLVETIVDVYEKHVGHEAKMYDTLATPGQRLEKNEGEMVEQEKYRSIVGKIMYLVTKIFVEGSNAARELARHFSNPGEEHWKELGRFVGYLKQNKDEVRLTLRKPIELRPVSNVDSDYATDKETRRSVSGAIHTMGGMITNWTSKTQPTVALSSTEAEYYSLTYGAQEIMFATMLIAEVAEVELPGVILEDNTGAIFLVKNKQVGQRTKHIDIRHHFIRDLLDDGKIAVVFVKSEDNESDLCTKNVTQKVLNRHVKNIRDGDLTCRREWNNIMKEIGKKDYLARREDVEN